jgi:hypothetical protein
LAHSSGRAKKLAEEQNRSDDQKVEEIYLAAYGRLPSQPEVERAKAHLLRVGSGEGDRVSNLRRAWEDLLWALISSGEFLLNH